MSSTMLRMLALAGVLAGASPAGLAGTPSPAPAVFEAEAGGRVLHVRGPVDAGFDARLRHMLASHPVETIVLEGPGGLRHQALQAARAIRDRGIVVRVSGRCASACALLWAASPSREMTPGSAIGLHASRIESNLPLPAGFVRMLGRHNDRVTAGVLRRAGFPPSIIALGDRTPATSMSWFDPASLHEAGVGFRLLDGQGLAPMVIATAAADH